VRFRPPDRTDETSVRNKDPSVVPTTRETILAVLQAQLSALRAIALRGDVRPERVPSDGLLIGGLLATVVGSATARTALRHGVTAPAIRLVLPALRRSGERAGRVAEQLETTERSHHVQRRMLEAAARPPSFSRRYG